MLGIPLNKKGFAVVGFSTLVFGCWFYGFIVLCFACYIVVVLWCYIVMVVLVYSFMALWFYSFMVLRFHGFIVLWFYGVLVLKIQHFRLMFREDIDPISMIFKMLFNGSSSLVGAHLFPNRHKNTLGSRNVEAYKNNISENAPMFSYIS